MSHILNVAYMLRTYATT